MSRANRKQFYLARYMHKLAGKAHSKRKRTRANKRHPKQKPYNGERLGE